MLKNPKEAAAGMFFVAVGMIYGSIAWSGLRIGSALQMGPGYFPIVLAGVLVVFGVIMIARAFIRAGETPIGPVPWRSLLLILAATVFFATFIERVGLFPGVFITAAIASLAYSELRPLRILTVSAGLAAFCTLVFAYAVRVPIPVVGPAFGGWL